MRARAKSMRRNHTRVINRRTSSNRRRIIAAIALHYSHDRFSVAPPVMVHGKLTRQTLPWSRRRGRCALVRSDRRGNSTPKSYSGCSMGNRSEQSPPARARRPAGAEGAGRRVRPMQQPVRSSAAEAAAMVANPGAGGFCGGESRSEGCAIEGCTGADRTDPRLFYFRALLESGRFFGGGMAAMFAATGKRA